MKTLTILSLFVLLSGCGSARNADQQSSDAPARRGYVVDMKDVEAVGYSSIEELLIARVPGVRRAPDGNGIIIRGPRSIQESNQPLYVVDGVPSGSPPNLNLQEVSDVEVLMDMAALSTYGSRGMHGVVLIRTKSPPGGQD